MPPPTLSAPTLPRSTAVRRCGHPVLDRGVPPLCCSHRSRMRVRSCAVDKRRAPLPQTDRQTDPHSCDTAAPSRLPHPGQRRDYRLVLDRGLIYVTVAVGYAQPELPGQSPGHCAAIDRGCRSDSLPHPGQRRDCRLVLDRGRHLALDRLRHRTPLAPVNCGVATPYLTGADPPFAARTAHVRACGRVPSTRRARPCPRQAD